MPRPCIYTAAISLSRYVQGVGMRVARVKGRDYTLSHPSHPPLSPQKHIGVHFGDIQNSIH